MIDSAKHKGMRKKLIQELREKGIEDEQVLRAFDLVPRHFFLDLAFVNQAYSNVAFQIGEGQTISHPFTVALQSQLLNLQKGEKVLEIGTGSGFQTGILLKMGAKVYSIERQRKLYLSTNALFNELNYNAKLFYGDGFKGLPTYAPFDKIIVTCGAPFLPEMLIEQLKPNGILVIPIGEGEQQIMHRYTKISESEVEKETFGVFSFVPMLEQTAK